jgi:DNA-directed RNA polymerase subunit RPC12/RpoP
MDDSSIRCKDCNSRNVRDVRHVVSRTKGFHPDYECGDCGFRWIDQGHFGARRTLRELFDATKEFHGESGVTESKVLRR